MPPRPNRRQHIGLDQRIHDILRGLSQTTKRKLSEKTSIRSRVQRNKKLSKIFRTEDNEGYFVSKKILANMISTTMNNSKYTAAISKCEMKGWLMVLDDPSEIKALFPRNSSDAEEASSGKPILFLTKDGQARTKGMSFCKYEKFDDVLKGMANEYDNETQKLILKLAEMIGKDKPNPFYQIDNPNAI